MFHKCKVQASESSEGRWSVRLLIRWWSRDCSHGGQATTACQHQRVWCAHADHSGFWGWWACTGHSNLAPLKHTTMKIYLYGTEEELPFKGQITATVEAQHTSAVAIFYIASAGNCRLLTYDTAKELCHSTMELEVWIHSSSAVHCSCCRPWIKDCNSRPSLLRVELSHGVRNW